MVRILSCRLILVLSLQIKLCEQSHSISPAGSTLYLEIQEVPNLPKALLQITINSVLKPHIALPVMYRAIEMLVTHGFESKPYQELLQQPIFTTAILTACEKLKEIAVDKENVRLNLNSLAWLTEKNTYLMRGHFEQSNVNTSDQACITLLNEYIDWWLEGGSVSHQDLGQQFEDTGILDPIEDIPATERVLLDCRFPLLWYALMRTPSMPDQTEILWKIITQGPSGVPDFTGLDLWLQRRAALIFYDKQGLAPFLHMMQESAGSIRIALLKFIVGARAILPEDKAALLARLDGYWDGHEGFDADNADEWYWADI